MTWLGGEHWNPNDYSERFYHTFEGGGNCVPLQIAAPYHLWLGIDFSGEFGGNDALMPILRNELALLEEEDENDNGLLSGPRPTVL